MAMLHASIATMKACLNMSSCDSTRGKSASGKKDQAETSVCMPVCSGCCSARDKDKMLKSRKRKRSRRRHHSSSSQSSSERLGLASRRRFIAIAHKTPPSQQDMVTVLASELRPEHKLPKKEIWVSPKPQFLKLLRSVGASGNTFTAKEVLSYLIKYISSRQLYDPQDPKNVFCNSDPLGQVFNVHSFTIKDAKRLLFENMKVLDKPPESPTIPRLHSMPETRKDCYITFRNNQEHTHEMAPTPPYPLPHHYSHPTPQSAFQSAVKVISSEVDIADGIGKGVFDNQVLETMLDTLSEGREGGTDEPDVGISLTPPAELHHSSVDNIHGGSMAIPAGSLSESNHSAGVLQGNTQFPRRRKKHPKRRHQKHVMARKCRSRSESSSLTLASRASCRSSQMSSSKRSMHRSSQGQRSSAKRSRGDMADGRSREDRPWYCIFYNAQEDVKSQSSDIYSVQGKETAVVTDTSDDLWFMDDDRFSVEYEVEDSESESEVNDTGSDSTTTEAEIFVEVDELGSGSDSRFADEDTTDSEIPEEDKWTCSECSQVNNPVHGYCSFCWARRSGWLADEDRKNPTERLGDKHILRRAFSAPAGCQLETMNQASISGRVQGDRAPCASDEAGTGHPSAYPHHFYSPPQDFADGKTGDEDEQGSVQEERHIFSQISSPGRTSPLRSLQPLRTQDVKAPHLTTVDEAPEEASPADMTQGHALSSSQGRALQEDQGVGSDASQNTLGVSDTVSRHSSHSSGDIAGCMPRKRKALPVNREDSGVCLKRQSSGYSAGHSGKDDAGPIVKGGLLKHQELPIVAPEAYGHDKMFSKASSQPIPSGSSSNTGPPAMAANSMCEISPGTSSLTDDALVGPNSTGILTPPLAQGATGTAKSTVSHHSRVGSSLAGGRAMAGHPQEMCRFCCVRPKTACIIHGRTGHQVCCYRCAKKLRRRGKPCPVCRRPIQHIVKNFYA